ncbi:MAG: DNA polymerase I [Planctomycetes bacterium]|nr:DNA polymerase I [Planctomycetota bacterium]
MARVFLLDGTALAYRAHFAMARSGLTSPEGLPTGAVFGFTSTLRRILREEKPDLIAVALDPKGPTFRHRQYAEYKATREKAPEEMIAQLDLIREVVRAHGIPLFEVPGFEADDVIGTLSREAEAAGHEVMIVTGDKDLMQLVSESVRLYNVFKPGVELVIEGLEAVKNKFGTTPDHVIDVLAIMGDASDNVPGVKGIGEKGAQKLIGEFGSVQGVLDRLEEVKGKNRERIEEQRDQLLMSLDLVTIDTQVPLDPGFAGISAPEPDVAVLAELFRSLDFRSMAQEVSQAVAREEEVRDYVTVTSPSELEAMIAELREAGRFSFDSETTGLQPLEVAIVGLSFSAQAGRAFYVPFNASPPVLPGGTEALLEALRPLLEDPELERIAQNWKYDALVLSAHGIQVPPPAFDTMVASFTLAGATRRHNLDDLALVYFGLHKIPTSAIIGKGKNQVTMAEVLVEQVAEYACEDAEVTWRLFEAMAPEIDESGNAELFHDLELPLIPVLAAMERRGIRLDVERVEAMGEGLEADIEASLARIRELAGVPDLNPGSTKALGKVLFEDLCIQDEAGVKRVKKTKTGYATDQATLNQFYGEVEIVKELLQYRELTKLKSTYVDALPRYVNARTGRVHCSFSQVSAATGRLACSDPNLQNIPVRTERGRRLRECFVPRLPDESGEWVLLAADYSQVELRIMAHLAQEPFLIEAFGRGEDIHSATAAAVFGVDAGSVERAMRSQAKAINFGLLYGMGPQRLARETGLTLPEAQEFIGRYFEALPRVKEWLDRTRADAEEHGFVTTLSGRVRALPDLTSSNRMAQINAQNAAVNTPVQGSAADIIKRAMIDLEARLEASPLRAQLLLQVHDELVLEVPVSELEATREMVREAMEGAADLAVPLAVDFGHGASWLEAH